MDDDSRIPKLCLASICNQKSSLLYIMLANVQVLRDGNSRATIISEAQLQQSGITFVRGEQQFREQLAKLIPLILQPADMQLLVVKVARQLASLLRTALPVASGRVDSWPLRCYALAGSSAGSMAELGREAAWQALRKEQGSATLPLVQIATELSGGIVDTAELQWRACHKARERLRPLGIEVPDDRCEALQRRWADRLSSGGTGQGQHTVDAINSFKADLKQRGFQLDTCPGAKPITHAPSHEEGLGSAEAREAAAAQWLKAKHQHYTQHGQHGFAELVECAMQHGATAVNLVIAYATMSAMRPNRQRRV